jgi:hypothetical protein
VGPARRLPACALHPRGMSGVRKVNRRRPLV